MALTKASVHSRATFVRSAVKEIAVTTKIIDAIMPYFPKRDVVIAGYLNDSDQYWKVNYHWELLVRKIDDFRALDIDWPAMKAFAGTLRDILLSNPPVPQKGYVASREVGSPVDASTAETIIARHTLVRDCKKEFEWIITSTEVVDSETKSNPPSKDKTWWLACAPVRKPGTSTHGSGCALDIAGDNSEIKQLALGLGATMAFNEASHVHCEWQKGVKLPAS